MIASIALSTTKLNLLSTFVQFKNIFLASTNNTLHC